MSPLKRLINRFRKSAKDHDPQEAEQLRLEFRQRYHWFRRLLRANRNALDEMTDIQAMLRSEQPFSMTRARTVCTRVSMEVWKIVHSLTNLAPGKYDQLPDRFQHIRKDVETRIAPMREAGQGPMVVSLNAVDATMAHLVGSKMAVLGEMQNVLDLTVPGGFAVTAAAFHRFMDANDLREEIDRKIRASGLSGLTREASPDMDALFSLSSSIQQSILNAPLPEELEQAMTKAWKQFSVECDCTPTMAVRSSALSEDGASGSFAGLHRSMLNVNQESFLEAYKEVAASLYSLQAMTYRLSRGIPDEDAAMCVGVLRMVEARSGGVLYTEDPVSDEPGMIVNAVWGLPKGVVDGRCGGDIFRISPDGSELLSAAPHAKGYKYVPLADEGVHREEIEACNQGEPALSEEEVLELGAIAQTLKERFDGPLDIEWAWDELTGPVVLQCRPLHRAAHLKKAGTEAEPPGPVLLQGGVTASPGVAAGPVHVVRKSMDTLNFPDGGVLVTQMALPRLAALLGRASAVVAEVGNVAGHLAAVSREFDTPALFSVENAVETLGELENGRVVTLDADNGWVVDGDFAPAREHVETAAPRETTPVHAALKAAAERIVPLHLVDPASASFRPGNCRTYHDITRFCHEKSVDEMFRFGKDHHFPERSSKQLYTHAPVRWWVLNLDDGFTEEVEGKYVKLDQIACRPMLAIWRGVVAFPWGGPPPLDAGGFMAVMFRSTTDTRLTAGTRSKLAERNYFLISRQYCSLSSRLGYHFTTVEALVGDRPSENYCSFLFKGGAADDDRRARRVELIREILDEHGFTTEVRQDNLIARVQGHPTDHMYTLLKILGYLTIHTRQIDMVMANDRDVARYREKYRNDIKLLLEPEETGGENGATTDGATHGNEDD